MRPSVFDAPSPRCDYRRRSGACVPQIAWPTWWNYARLSMARCLTCCTAPGTPHAVGFGNRNVIHLLRNVMIQAVLPDFGVRVPGDWEGRGALVCVLDDIEAGVVNRSEVEFRIGIPQPGR